jgi:hypothetical protein
MPIRFRCPHCQRKLKARNDKAEQQMACPNCGQPLTVPAHEAVDPNRVEGLAEEEQRAHADPFAELIVYDDEIVYETDEPQAARDTFGKQVATRQLVGVSRRLIYAHAILLAILPLTGLAVGYLIGRTDRQPSVASGPPAPRRVLISGRLQWTGTTGALADKGAVVIALPHDLEPQRKLPGEGLGPDKPQPQQGDPRVRAIEDWGGDYTRTNDVGEFQLFLLPGRYYILSVSHQSDRRSHVEPSRDDLASIGKFFTAPHEIIGPHRYHWTITEIKEGSQYAHEFKLGRPD